MNYQDINSKTIDRWVAEGWEWGKPITHEEYLDAKKGIWDVLLTPTKRMIVVTSFLTQPKSK